MSIFDKFKKKLAKPVSQKKGEAERSRFAAVGAQSHTPAKSTAGTVGSGKAVKAASLAESRRGVHGLGEMDRIVIGPVISEKSTDVRKANQYVFEVSGGANKSQIKKAFALYYGVVPKKVNSVRLPGKPVRFGRSRGVTKVRRKMIVTLPKGKSIEI